MSVVIPGPDIRNARRAQAITQTQLAGEMGVTQAAVSQWENEQEEMGWDRYFDALAAVERIVKRRDREAAAMRERACAAAKQREAKS